MKFTLDGAEVEIRFHFQDAVTLCSLVITSNLGAYVFGGYALCSSRDRFVKETGRKIALRRALEMAGVDKVHRKAIWLKYLSRNEISDDIAFLLAIVPEAEFLSLEEAYRLLEERDRQAAQNLMSDFMERRN
jgi:hypothetical protein